LFDIPEGDAAVKINSLATTTLSFIALLGLTVAMPACEGKTDDSDDEAGDGDTDTGTDTGTEDESSDSGDTTEDDTTDTTTAEDTTTDDDTTTEETGGDLPNGASCTSDGECMSGNCYVVPFLGGQCGECNEDADCAMTTGGGCTPPNPFEANGSVCNMGELGGGCETTDVCEDGLVCGNVLDLLGLIQINTCGNCENDDGCMNGQICAPIVSVMEFSGINDCIDPGTLEQDAFCLLEGNGNEACSSGICSTIDIMGLAMIGACGECNTDADCMGGSCVAGEFNLDTAMLSGSTCQ
jgi:hypothetical protein